MEDFKTFFSLNPNGVKKRHYGTGLTPAAQKKFVPDYHKTKKDVDAFRTLKANNEKSIRVVTDKEALELFKKFNIVEGESEVHVLGNTGITIYKNPAGTGYILKRK